MESIVPIHQPNEIGGVSGLSIRNYVSVVQRSIKLWQANVTAISNDV